MTPKNQNNKESVRLTPRGEGSVKDDNNGKAQLDMEQIEFLRGLKQSIKQLQQRLKIEIRHKLELFKEISSLRKQL